MKEKQAIDLEGMGAPGRDRKEENEGHDVILFYYNLKT